MIDWPVALQCARVTRDVGARVPIAASKLRGGPDQEAAQLWVTLQNDFIQTRCAIRRRKFRVAARKFSDVCNSAKALEQAAEGTPEAAALAKQRGVLQQLLEMRE